MTKRASRLLHARQKFGKYRIDRRIAKGGFADVYRAYDTIEGTFVALKIPHVTLVNDDTLQHFRQEVRLTAKLDHPNILAIKNADFIENVFVIVYPLGDQSLAERMQSRMSLQRSLDYAKQMLTGLAFAHGERIMHCDVKPENFILFGKDRIRLTDFGIAKVSLRTLSADGTGTLGYIAPEQAMGKPSFRSDVFSMGIVLYQMFARVRPEWPFDWPPPGYDRIRGSLHPDLIAFLQRSLVIDHMKRFRDAEQMLRAFTRARPHALKFHRKRRNGRNAKPAVKQDWQKIRYQQFVKRYRRMMDVHDVCRRCNGPVGEMMMACPWCGTSRKIYRGTTKFPAVCKRCKRGVKRDWRYCPWCYGGKIQDTNGRQRYSDVRYLQNGKHATDAGMPLMRFMQYSPWSNKKIKWAWRIPAIKDVCQDCGWGVLKDYWAYCPWCNADLRRKRSKLR